MRYHFTIKGFIEPHLLVEFRDFIDEHFTFIQCKSDFIQDTGHMKVQYDFLVPEELREEATSIIHLFDRAEWEETDRHAMDRMDSEW